MTGNVKFYDLKRGWGFIVPEQGQDVFMHRKWFRGSEDALVPGASVQFDVFDGDRGREAYNIEVLNG